MAEQQLQKVPVPSKSAIARATVVAFVIALIVLFAAILPAEYGVDPLRTGSLLGLTALSTTAEADASPGAPVTVPVVAGTFTGQPKTYKVDAQDLVLHPGEGVEIKYHMEKGAAMVYSWKATGKLMFEFHGEPDQKPNPDYYDSYELDDKVGKQESFGSFIAPSTGIHGWFWENKGDKNVEIRLTAAGFFDSAKMFAGGPPEDLPVEDVK
jgi:hypothetical protein